MIPMLEDVAAHARDSISRGYAVEAIAAAAGRGRGPITEAQRLQLVARHGRAPLRDYATEKDADRIIAALTKPRKGDNYRGIILEATRLLLDRLGEPGRKAVEDAMDRLDPEVCHARPLAAAGDSTWNKALDDLHAAGVIAIDRRQLLAKMDAIPERTGSARTSPSTPRIPEPYSRRLAVPVS